MHEKRMKGQDALIDKFDNILTTFEEVQVSTWVIPLPPMGSLPRAIFGVMVTKMWPTN